MNWYDDLPQRWKNNLSEWILENGLDYSKKYMRLSASDFPTGEGIKIKFDDESYAFFQYSFYIIDERIKEFAVFTEHCGYHVFNLGEILIETIDWEGNRIKTYDNRTE